MTNMLQGLQKPFTAILCLLSFCLFSGSCERERVVEKPAPVKFAETPPPTQDVVRCSDQKILLSANPPQVTPKFCYGKYTDLIEWTSSDDFSVDFDDSPFDTGEKHIDKTTGKKKLKDPKKVRLYHYTATIGTTTLDPHIIIMP
jgi:hypothetical protein